MDPRGFTFGVGLGILVGEFVIVGAIAWVLRRFWKSAFGPPLVPATILAMFKLLAASVADPLGMAQGALISAIVGLAWWTILAWRDAHRKDKKTAER